MPYCSVTPFSDLLSIRCLVNYEARILSKWRYEPRLRAIPRKRVVYEPRALSSVDRKCTGYCHVYHRTVLARTATSTEDDAQEEGRDGADGSRTNSSEMGEIRGVIQNCENTVRVRSTQEWQASLRKRRTNASGEGGEQQRRKRRKASGARVPKVERRGGRAPQMTRLVAVGQVAVQRIEGHSGWVRRRRPERGKRRRQPDHDDG